MNIKMDKPKNTFQLFKPIDFSTLKVKEDISGIPWTEKYKPKR